MGKYISLFAGVGGFDLGMEQAGHECVAQVEWDKNAAGVLKHRWPNVPLFCDVSKVSADDLPDADFITYGFPCQDLSVAGKREGLDGKRSGLFYEATRLIRELRSRGCGLRFAVAENVAGLFSADDGLALARCIRELLDSGACETGWALFDSQYFGVAQRRKRVFIVSDFGGESVDEILAITESLPGHPPPSREAGKGTAEDATEGVGEGGDVVGSLAARDYKGVGNQYFNEGKVVCRASDQANAETLVDKAPTLSCNRGGVPIAAQSEYQGQAVDRVVSDTVCSKSAKGSGGPSGNETGNMITQAQGADVYNGELTGETSATVTSATGLVSGSGPKVIETRNMITQAQSTGSDPDLMATLCAKDNEKVGSNQWVKEGKAIIEQKETYCLQGGGETLQSSQGSGVNKDVAFTLNGLDKHGVVSWNGDTTPKASEDVSVTLRSQQGGEGVGVAHAPLTVRRLTPIECERLQGFPDNWTSEKMELILEGNEWKATGKVAKQADGPRYKQMGNAVTVNVAEYLGKQIAKTL